MATAAESALTSALARKYYTQMKAGYATTLHNQPSAASGGAANLSRATGTGSAVAVKAAAEPTNLGSKLLDLFMQPGYAVTQEISNISGAVRGVNEGRKSVLGAIGDVITAGDPFGKGNQKKSGIDLVSGNKDLYNEIARKSGLMGNTYKQDVGPFAANESDNNLQKFGKGALGFAAGVALDPLSYVGVGAVGQALKGGGKLIGAAAEGLNKAAEGSKLAAGVSKVASGITKAGEGTLKVDSAINNATTKVINKALDPTGKKAAAKAIQQAAVDEAAKTASDAAQLVARNATIDPLKSKFVIAGKGLDFGKPVNSVERMLQNTETGLSFPAATVPKGELSRLMDLPKKPTYDFAKLQDPTGHVLTPFTEKAVTQQAVIPPAQDTLMSELLKPGAAVEADAKALASDATRAVTTPANAKITFEEHKAWIAKNKSVKLAIQLPLTTKPTVFPVAEWLNKLGSTRASALSGPSRKAVNDSLAAASNKGIMADRAALLAREAGATPAPGLATLAADGLPVPPAPTVPAKGASPVVAAQVAVDRSVHTTPVWVDKPPTEQASIKRRFKNMLDEEHFTYLYEGIGRKSPLPIEEQRSLFNSRVRQLAKGKATSQPRYIEFFQKQVIDGAKPIVNSNPRFAAVARSPKSIEFNGISVDLSTADEIAKNVPTDSASVAERQQERVRTAQNMDEQTKTAIKATMGKDAIKDGVHGQQFDSVDKTALPFTTPVQGTLRDSPNFGEGLGVNRVYNTHAQFNLHRALAKTASDEVKALSDIRIAGGGKMIWGLERAQMMMDRTIPRVQAAERYFRAHGVEPVGGVTVRGVPLGFGDALGAMSMTNEGRELLKHYLYGGLKGTPYVAKSGAVGTIYPDAIMRVFATVVDKMDASAINAAKGGQDVLEVIAREVYAKLGVFPKGEELAKIVTEGGKNPISIAIKGAKPGEYIQQAVGSVDSATVIQKLEDVIFNSTKGGKTDLRILNNIVQTVQQRSAANAIAFGDTVHELTDKAMTNVFDFMDQGKGVKETVDFLNTKDLIDSVKNSQSIKPTREQLLGAAMRLQEDMSNVISVWDLKHRTIFEQITKGAVADGLKAGGAEKNKAMLKVMQLADEQIATENPFRTPAELSLSDVESLDTAAYKMRTSFANMFVPSKIVNDAGKWVTSRLHETWLFKGSLGRDLSKDVRSQLTVAYHMGTTEEIALAMRYIQDGTLGAASDLTKSIAAKLSPVSSMYFDHAINRNLGPEGTNGILRDFFQHGYDLKHVADKMSAAHFGIPEKLQFDWAKVDKAVGVEAKNAELHTQWMNMKIDNPIDYLARMDATIGNLASDVAMSQGVWKKIKELGGVSLVPKDGYVALRGTTDNYITRYFPETEGAYFIEKTFIPELKKLDYLLKTSIKTSEGVGRMLRTYDPLLNIWKSGMTIWNPNHHLRNVVGDMSLSFLADGLKNPRYYYRAIGLLKARKLYDGVDMLRMMQGIEDLGKVQESRYMLKASLGGRAGKFTISDAEFYEAMYRRGVIKDFTQQEDLIESGLVPKGIQHLQDMLQVTGGKARERVGSLSEGRDDFVRLAHALHLLENKSTLQQAGKVFKNREELFNYVAHRVNQVHPDGTDLAPFERKVMRRLIPFYSWMRKAIPLTIESALQHPGRFTTYPKFAGAMANQYGAQGGTLSNPFPSDQMFPSWLTNQTTGPVTKTADGSYYGISPGTVDSDFMDQWIAGGPAGAKNTLLDMISPMIKLPVELQNGRTLGSGIQTPAKDPLEYFGSQIPGIAQMQRLFGTDPLGSVGTLVQGQGLDPTQSVQKGNRGQMDVSKWLNLSGIGSQNYSTDSALHAAAIEARNRARGQ